MRAKHLLALWIGSGLALLGLEVVAWVWPQPFQLWLGEMQSAYGVSAPVPWILQTDTHAHLLVSCLVVLWFAFGCRLLAPRAIPWLPIASAMVVALSDEILQLGATSRSFDWGDQAADGLGIALAIPFALWMRHMPVRPGAGSQGG